MSHGSNSLASALVSATGHAEPYPIYAELRRQEPVARWYRPGAPASWLVTRYDDVAEVLASPSFVSDPAMAGHARDGQEAAAPLSRLLTTTDPPEHTRLRAAARGAFTPRAVEAARPRVQDVADALLDGVEGSGSMELMDDFAFPFAVTVIAELLGLPREDEAMLRGWSRLIVDCDFGMSEADAERRRRVARDEIVPYVEAVLARKRSNPDRTLTSDLARGDLDEAERVGLVWLLLADGYEAVACLIGTGVLGLLRQPGQWARLCADPGMAGRAVEELFRYAGPAATLVRYACEDVEVGGRRISRGDVVTVALSSANRDDARFPDPDRLDIDRCDASSHLAFGRGVHYCIGAGLARLECVIAIGTLARRLPQLRLAVPVENLEWRPSVMLRGLRTLPVTF